MDSVQIAAWCSLPLFPTFYGIICILGGLTMFYSLRIYLNLLLRITQTAYHLFKGFEMSVKQIEVLRLRNHRIAKMIAITSMGIVYVLAMMTLCVTVPVGVATVIIPHLLA